MSIVDEENSIYVGGLPFDCSEDDIRKAFDLYGSIVSVKIINERDHGGKCYGFVTFTNPRCAVDAISDTNGRKIRGRVVRVNEVRTRGGKSHLNRGNNRRDTDRNLDWDRERDRERSHDHDRERYRDRSTQRSRDRDWERNTEYERPRDHDRRKDRFLNGDQDLDRENSKLEFSRKQDRDLGKDFDKDWDRDRKVDTTNDRQKNEPEFNRKQDRDLGKDFDKDWDRDRKADRTNDRENKGPEFSREQGQDLGKDFDKDWGQDRKADRTNDHVRRENDKDQLMKSRTDSQQTDWRDQELSSNSNDDYQDQVKDRLELSTQRRVELLQEISHIQGNLDEREIYVSDLEKKFKQLEDSLAVAKKLSSQKRMQLAKFQRCILQVNNYTTMLKSCEQELQSLVDTVMEEADDVEDAAVMDGSVYINSKS